MILFRKEHVQPILEGRKTETRRLGKKRWNVGAIHQAKTQRSKEPFAWLRIVAVRCEYLTGLNDDDAKAEGYDNIATYLDMFTKINTRRLKDEKDLVYMVVWVVKFLLEAPECQETRLTAGQETRQLAGANP